MFYEGETITVIGSDGKPSEIAASSLNLASSRNIPGGTFASNQGASGNKSNSMQYL